MDPKVKEFTGSVRLSPEPPRGYRIERVNNGFIVFKNHGFVIGREMEMQEMYVAKDIEEVGKILKALHNMREVA